MPGINSFLNQVHECIRLKHLSIHTEDSYLSTIRRFINFPGKNHPAQLPPDAARQYLSHLATEQNVAASKNSEKTTSPVN